MSGTGSQQLLRLRVYHFGLSTTVKKTSRLERIASWYVRPRDIHPEPVMVFLAAGSAERKAYCLKIAFGGRCRWRKPAPGRPKFESTPAAVTMVATAFDISTPSIEFGSAFRHGYFDQYNTYPPTSMDTEVFESLRLRHR